MNFNRILCPGGHLYNASHIQKYGFYCPYKHSEYNWPTRKGEQVSLLISDSICKFIKNMNTCGVQAFPGATIQQLTMKVKLGYVEFHSFKNIIVHVGTNDVVKCDVQQIVHKYDLLISAIQKKAPNAKIFVSSVIPRPKDCDELQIKLSLINAEIRLLCRQRGIYNLKTFNVFGKSNSPEFLSYYAVDKLHLSRKGTLKLAKYFEGNLLKYKN